MNCPRDLFVNIAHNALGLSFATRTRPSYLDVICPNTEDRADTRKSIEMGLMSGCALTVRGLWWRAGVLHPILAAPYRNGRAVADLVEVARDAGALCSADHAIEAGDVVIVEKPEHVLTVVEVRDDLVCSIDGGQRDASGAEAILYRERAMNATAGTLANRPILFIVDALALAARWRLVPDTLPSPPPPPEAA